MKFIFKIQPFQAEASEITQSKNLGGMKRFTSILPDPKIAQQTVVKLQWRSPSTIRKVL